jgi:hypothetical protein
MNHFDPSWCARLHAPRPAAPAASGSVTRTRFVPRHVPGPGEHACERCATRMDDRHCKIVCPNCGYQRDCSDP